MAIHSLHLKRPVLLVDTVSVSRLLAIVKSYLSEVLTFVNGGLHSVAFKNTRCTTQYNITNNQWCGLNRLQLIGKE